MKLLKINDCGGRIQEPQAGRNESIISHRSNFEHFGLNELMELHDCLKEIEWRHSQ